MDILATKHHRRLRNAQFIVSCHWFHISGRLNQITAHIFKVSLTILVRAVSTVRLLVKEAVSAAPFSSRPFQSMLKLLINWLLREFSLSRIRLVEIIIDEWTLARITHYMINVTNTMSSCAICLRSCEMLSIDAFENESRRKCNWIGVAFVNT